MMGTSELVGIVVGVVIVAMAFLCGFYFRGRCVSQPPAKLEESLIKSHEKENANTRKKGNDHKEEGTNEMAAPSYFRESEYSVA